MFVQRPDPVRLLLLVLVLIAALLPPLNFAPNRLFPGQAVSWLKALDNSGLLWACGALLLTAGAVFLRALTLWAVATLTCGNVWVVGHAAQQLTADGGTTARATLSAGFWLILFSAFLLLIDTIRREKQRRSGISVLLALCAFTACWLYSGEWSAISLIREYHNEAERFAIELQQHVLLVAASFIIVLGIGFPLGWWLSRRNWAAAPAFAVLNIVQTVPSIALFALLLAPLAALARHFPILSQWGLGGIGVVPAVIALVLYTLLPLVRNTYAAFRGINPALREAARGMGMTPWQVWCKVELPLALPVILSGIRIVLVQAIGLAVVAGLIGAGGLGTFVWQGLGQYAMDLVLLGAIPTILLALTVDGLLQWLMMLTATEKAHA